MRFSTAHPRRDLEFGVERLDGGLNFALPPHDIKPNQLYEALNFYYDIETGRLATRPGLVAETTTALAAGAMQVFAATVGGTRYILAATNSKLYKLASGALTLIGTLASSSTPTFTPFNDKLYIASGGLLQRWNGTSLDTPDFDTITGTVSEDPPDDTTGVLTDAAQSMTVDAEIGRTLVMTSGTANKTTYLIADNDGTTWTLTDSAGASVNLYSDGVRLNDTFTTRDTAWYNGPSYSCTIVIAKDGRLFINDISDDDMVWVSGPLLDSEWGFPHGAQFQAGFTDGDAIIAMIPFGHDLIIAKGPRQRSLFVLKGIYPKWHMEELARGTTTFSQHSHTKVQRDMLLLDIDGLNSLSGVVEYGDLKVDPLGGQIVGYLTAELNSTGFIVQWPSQGVALVFPNNTASLAYVLHYSLSGDVPRWRWTRFLFGVGQLTSAVYDVTADKIYLGCNDGKLYSLSKTVTDTVYQDDGTDYVQRLATKVFDPPNRMLLFKGHQFMYEPLASGAGKVSLVYNDANVQVDLETFTITKFVVDVWTTPVLDDYDFPPMSTPQASTVVRSVKRLRVRNMQMGIVVNSGAISISRMAIRAAAVGRE